MLVTFEEWPINNLSMMLSDVMWLVSCIELDTYDVSYLELEFKIQIQIETKIRIYKIYNIDNKTGGAIDLQTFLKNWQYFKSKHVDVSNKY